jgi:hypothetical protein
MTTEKKPQAPSRAVQQQIAQVFCIKKGRKGEAQTFFRNPGRSRKIQEKEREHTQKRATKVTHL